VNSSPIVFYGSGDSKVNLETDVADGAGYLLEAYANTLVLMKKIEWSGKDGINTDELKSLVDTAIKNMESARESYIGLTRKADNTPYNPAILEKLKAFDYDALQKANGLNPVVLAPVKTYLAKGCIRTLYYQFLADMEGIITLLKQVKEQVDTGNLTPVKEIWQLNGLFAKVLLRGQYVSQVFHCLSL
jgi:hypothetical protein